MRNSNTATIKSKITTIYDTILYSLYHKILWFDSIPDGKFVHLGDLQMCQFECVMVGPVWKRRKEKERKNKLNMKKGQILIFNASVMCTVRKPRVSKWDVHLMPFRIILRGISKLHIKWR